MCFQQALSLAEEDPAATQGRPFSTPLNARQVGGNLGHRLPATPITVWNTLQQHRVGSSAYEWMQ